MVARTVGETLPLKTARGINHEVMVYPDRLVIRPVSLWSWFTSSEQSIALDEIDNVRVYTSRFWTAGWIHLVIIARDRKSIGLAFSQRQSKTVHEIKDTLADLMSRREAASYFKTLTP